MVKNTILKFENAREEKDEPTNLGLQKTLYKWAYGDLKSPLANYYV